MEDIHAVVNGLGKDAAIEALDYESGLIHDYLYSFSQCGAPGLIVRPSGALQVG